MPFDRLPRLFERLQTYSAWQVAVELALIWLVVYAVIRFVSGTRAAGAIKGTLVVLIVAGLGVRILGAPESFQRLRFLYDNVLTLLALALVVIFQPELRRGLIRLGETPLLRRAAPADKNVVDAVVDASAYLSRARFGGIIVLQRDSPLKNLIEGGTPIDARVSAPLLQTIFFPGSALHDLAVIIADSTVKAAGVQLPLADPEEMPDAALGSRHRAAVGLSKESDALVVVISEETGNISLAENGKLDQNLGADRLRSELSLRLNRRGVFAAIAAADDHPAPTHADLSDPRD